MSLRRGQVETEKATPYLNIAIALYAAKADLSRVLGPRPACRAGTVSVGGSASQYRNAPFSHARMIKLQSPTSSGFSAVFFVKAWLRLKSRQTGGL